MVRRMARPTHKCKVRYGPTIAIKHLNKRTYKVKSGMARLTHKCKVRHDPTDTSKQKLQSYGRVRHAEPKAKNAFAKPSTHCIIFFTSCCTPIWQSCAGKPARCQRSQQTAAIDSRVPLQRMGFMTEILSTRYSRDSSCLP